VTAAVFNHIPMSPTRLAVLGKLIEVGPGGTCSVRGVMDGAVLAVLVQMGLAERMGSDRLGGQRYRAALPAAADAWERCSPLVAARAKRWSTRTEHTQPMRARSGPQGSVASTPEKDGVSFYPTAPWGGRVVGEILRRKFPRARSLWEAAAGAHHMAHGLRDYFPTVHTSDAFDYGLGDVLYDYTSDAPPPFGRVDLIATNPPFHDDCIEQFIRRSWDRCGMGFALLHGERPMAWLAPFSERLPIHRGRYEEDGSTATDYAVFIFAQVRPFRGEARIIDIPPGAEARLTRPSDAAFAVREAA